MEDEFDIPRTKAVKIFAVVMFILCQPAIWFIHRGVLDDFDFWGANLIIVLGATLEIILLGWVFGMNKAWEELHKGSKIRIPRIFMFITKYITPLCLLGLLGWWFATEWLPVITMKTVTDENVPYVLGGRLLLLALFVFLAVMVFLAWRRRDEKKYY